MRPYRLWNRTTAQVSPPPLVWKALQLVRGASVADVGCGPGTYGYLLRTGWGHTESWLEQGITTPGRLYGMDNSARAAAPARRHRIYDRLDICPATALVLGDRAVDTALCTETVEHLYPADVVPAVRELARIAAQRVVITTPAPELIVDHAFLLQEIAEAREDGDPMPREEYEVLESALHKSWLSSERMAAAGFETAGEVICGSRIYHADPGKIDAEALGEVPGTARPAGPGADDGPGGDHRARYVALLESVREMAEAVPGLARGAGR
ncbi:class I SAM-dependent methyltransferase [Streptomyces sp. CAU 1734]|uniref:class I SAM-dependent methyltransferase n=1 Tax=Streptomyces sp. CAU 1734 TaxID=3140360 RepID=UPI003260472A